MPVLTYLLTLAGGALVLKGKVQSMEKTLDRVQDDHRELAQELAGTRERLSRMEGSWDGKVERRKSVS